MKKNKIKTLGAGFVNSLIATGLNSSDAGFVKFMDAGFVKTPTLNSQEFISPFRRFLHG